MSKARITFWADAPIGQVKSEREYDYSLYEDYEAFAETVDNDLTDWYQTINVGGYLGEYGWIWND